MKKKALGTVVSLVLLLLFLFVIAFSFKNSFLSFQTSLGAKNFEKKFETNFEIVGLEGNSLYVNNMYLANISLGDIEIDGEPCLITDTNLSLGINEVEVFECTKGKVVNSVVSVLVRSSQGIISKELYQNNVPCDNYTVEDFYGGDGTFGNPWQVCNCYQLQNLQNYLGGNFTFVNTIDCSQTASWNWNGTQYEGFIPVGTESSQFMGTIDGADNTVRGLYINRSEDLSGIIGVANKSSIKNIRLFSSTIEGGDSTGSLVGRSYGSVFANISATQVFSYGGSSVGGIIGEVYTSNLSNISISDGFVSGISSCGGLLGAYIGMVVAPEGVFYFENSSSDAYVECSDGPGGGLLGSGLYYLIINGSFAVGDVYSTTGSGFGGLAGLFAYNSILDNSYATGSVVGKNMTGGLVGLSFFCSIENSYATGSVVGGNMTGGLVGSFYGGFPGNHLEYTYASGAVSGEIAVGGLVGYAEAIPINYSFSTGAVTGTGDVGGVIGNFYSSGIDNSYWNNDSSNPSVGIGISFAPLSTNVFAVDDDLSYFYDSGNAPLSSWDGLIWNISGIALPLFN